ncbi:Aldehyde oxidase [Actinidia chinensis var. chinensis]|uniref:Aldehyde oxidase n=1 Tax=Actinidia chinensis var. chinensis TaxID=1590841 RepID=A0A2R6R4C5_ACTCC|nr:Aldehyde oxidase [Actinidia chinensis var. chinensis]
MATLLKSLFLFSLLVIFASAQYPTLPEFDGEDTKDDGIGTVVNGIDAIINSGRAAADAIKLNPFFEEENPVDDATPVLPSDDGEKPDFKTNYLGGWKIDNLDAGVSSMQMQLLPNNKAIMYDNTNLGPSNIQLQPPGNCRPFPKKPNELDCWAHAVEYDIVTAQVRTLKLLTDSWCSSGGLMVDGSLLSSGGFDDGAKAVRLLSPCEDCDWKENPKGLVSERWYATQEKLEDGSFIVLGGRRGFSFEIVQNSLEFPKKQVELPFLQATTDPYENNLYPFAHLVPDGNVFLLANNRSIILDPKSGKVIRELPVLPGGSRNYPSSGMSALLPLRIPVGKDGKHQVLEAEVLVCGGAKSEANEAAEKQGLFLPALQDCGRITVTDPNAEWEIEEMPSRRVMGDMLLLPTAQVIMLNGAENGVAGWNFADTPNLAPVIYDPKKNVGERFKTLKPSQIPRMYHSSSAVLPDGKVLVAGSNTNPRYNLTNLATYKTELRVEKFSPPYLDHHLDRHRPKIVEDTSDKQLGYGQQFKVEIQLEAARVKTADLKVTMLAPPFTTHGYSQNQRLLVLEPISLVNGQLTMVAPPSGKVAPPGYYILYVVHRGVPSRGMWVQIQ